jgi:hypothetical protein
MLVMPRFMGICAWQQWWSLTPLTGGCMALTCCPSTPFQVSKGHFLWLQQQPLSRACWHLELAITGGAGTWEGL